MQLIVFYDWQVFDGPRETVVTLFFLYRLQEVRLEVLKQILEQREEDHAELNTKRLDRLWLVNFEN